MPKKWQSLKNRVLVSTIQPEPDFSWTCCFHSVLDNVELIMYMQFQKLLMTGSRDMDKKHQKYPQNGFFPPFLTPQDFFFKNRALSLLYPYGALTSCKILEKTNEPSLRYLKTDQRTDHERTRTITKEPLGRTQDAKCFQCVKRSTIRQENLHFLEFVPFPAKKILSLFVYVYQKLNLLI